MDDELKLIVKADIAEGQKKLDEWDKRIKKSVSNEDGIINKLNKTLEGLKDKRNSANNPETISRYNKKIGEAENLLKKLTKTQTENVTSLDKMKNGWTLLTAKIAAVVAATKFFTDSVQSYLESEQAITNLSQAFADNGLEVEKNTEKLQAFASQMQLVTKYEDDATVAAAAQLEAMTGLSEDGLERALTAAMDFATVAKIELGPAVEMIGKSTLGARNQFMAWGIQVDDNLDKAAKLDEIVKKLNDNFGGKAQAAAKTYAGQLAILKNQFSDFQEAVGQGIVTGVTGGKTVNIAEMLGIGTGGQALQNVLTGVTLFFNKLVGAIKLNFEIGYTIVKLVFFDPLYFAFNSVVDIAQSSWTAIQGIFKGDGLSAFKKSFAEIPDKIGKNFDDLKKRATQSISNLSNDTLKLTTDWSTEYQRKITAASNAQKKLFDDPDLIAKRKKLLDEWTALTQSGMVKELAQLDTKYNEDVAMFKKGSDERLLIESNYQLARQRIIEKYNDENAAELKKISDEEKAEAMKAVDSITTIANTLASAIGGQVGEMISDVAALGKAIASGDAWQTFTAVAIMAINLVKAEIEKGNLFRQMNEQQTVDNLKNIDTALLQNQLDNLTVLHNAQTKQLEERQTAEMDLFMSSSAAGQAYNAMKAQEEADRVAGMDATERAKYDIQVKYEAEKKALEDKQAAEEKALAEQQKAERNRIRGQQFELEKRIAKDEAWIKVNQAFADIHSKFPMPWDEGTRNSLFGLLQDTYDRTVGAINSRVFIPEFAKGVTNFEGGLAKVHEGELLTNLPSGTNVIPSNRVSNTTQNMGQTFQINSLQLNGIQDVKGLAKALQDMANGMGKALFA